MVLGDDGSAAQLSRPSPLYGPLPRLRLENDISAEPPRFGQTTCGRRPRRKPSADLAFMTGDEHSLQKPECVSRPPSTATNTANTSSYLRSTHPRTIPAGVTGYEHTPLTTTCAGALSKIPKSNFREPISSRRTKSLAKENPSKIPRKIGNSYVTTISTQVLRSASSILNVGLFNVAPGNATYSSPYLSIDTLDDLSRWDMPDSLPSIPSPHGSPESSTTATAPTRPILSNPFSATDDDDNIFEDDSRFPPFRQPRVHGEGGIKKPRYIAKGRTNPTAAGTILNRHANAELLNAHMPLIDPANDLSSPLPVNAPYQKTSRNPLSATAPSEIFPKVNNSPLAQRSSSSAIKDALGCIHLGASDCDLSIVFPQTSHFEEWDRSDDSHIAIPAFLCISTKDPHAWVGMTLALPDVSLINIRCDDEPVYVRKTAYHPDEGYTARYMGAHLKVPTVKSSNQHTLLDNNTPMIERNQITLDGEWVRMYSRPATEGNGGTRILRRTDISKALSEAVANYSSQELVKAWYRKIWISIPTRLFVKRETRAFHLEARVWMMGDEKKAFSLDGNKDGQVFPLVSDARMTVSHLRTPREMDGVWWC